MREWKLFRIAVLFGASLVVASCSDDPTMYAEGFLTFTSHDVDLTRSVRVDTQFESQVLVQVSTDDQSEQLMVLVDVESGNVVNCSASGYVIAGIQFTRADGTVFTGSPSHGGDCTIHLSSGTEHGRDWMSMNLTGTLTNADGSEALELEGGYITIHNLVR